MSSVLKRLKETAEMREVGLTDRAQFRHAKYLSGDDGRARRYLRPQLTGVSEEDKLAKARSKAALKELHQGSRLKSFVKALRVFFGGKAG
jgi:hypothetical protein